MNFSTTMRQDEDTTEKSEGRNHDGRHAMSSFFQRLWHAPLSLRVFGIVVLLVFGTLPFWLHDGAGAAEPTLAQVVKGDMTVTVGGVGRLVSVGSVDAVETSSASAGQSASGAIADGVFAHTSGHVAKILVQPGQSVRVGQLLAVLDDNGVASTAYEQASMDVAVAEVELSLKRTADTSTGRPPSHEEVVAAVSAVTSARTKLESLGGPASSAEDATARAELSKAVAELAALQQSPSKPLESAVKAARLAVDAASKRLERVSAAPDASTVAAADAELAKAKADQAALTRAAAGPLPAELTAANQAITLAEKKLTAATVGGDPITIDEAQLELDTARAALAVLQRTPQAPTAEEIASAKAAVTSAQLRVNQLGGPRDAADVASAAAELARAESDLADLLRPSPQTQKEQLASAEDAVAAAKAKLAQLGVASPTDLAAAKAEHDRAEAELVVLKGRGGPATAGEIELADLRLKQARISLDGARAALDALEVRSTRAGTVTSVMLLPGSPVDANTAILAVSDLQHLEVSVALSEFDIAQVEAGLPALVSVDALGGKVIRGSVRLAAAAGTNANGVVTFPVRIALKSAPGLRPGMNVSVRIVVAERQGVLQVPLDAITQNSDGDPVVTVLDGETEVEHLVELGISSNNNVEILDGLEAGQHVLLAAVEEQSEEP